MFGGISISYLEEIFRYEERIFNDSHMGQLPGNLLLKLNTDSKILVSCPHSVKHIRNGKMKVADINTYGIGLLLNELFNVSLLTLTGYNETDPNYDETCSYKELLSHITKLTDISFIIDLHGCANSEKYDCILATDYNGTLLEKNFLSEEWMKLDYLRTSYNYPFHTKPNTIAQYSAYKLGIPSLELELSNEVRCTDKVDLFVKQFETYLNDIKKHLL